MDVVILMLLAALALQVADIVTTHTILKRGGYERNPVVRLFMKAGRGWMVPKLALFAAPTWFVMWFGFSMEQKVIYFVAAIAGLALVVFNNVTVLRRMGS